jgi:hypothetical protein
MAQQRHRVNLSAANFPFSQTFFGQSVIVGRQDQNFNREVDSNADSDKDRGIPQIYYCHNVVPTGQGFQSVGFDQRIAPYIPAVNDFDGTFVIRDDDDNHFLFSPANGQNYIWDSYNFAWVANAFPVGSGITPSTLVTTAFIRGITYICYAGYGTFVYDKTTRSLVRQTLVGLNDVNVAGLCAAQGYLIAWDFGTTVAWSNPINELDFVPDITTGAGGGDVYDLRGNITCCVPINNGFIAYSKNNAVGASYSGNVTYPFVFKEVAGSGGISGIHQVSYDDNTGTHYAYTTIGFQAINKSDAKQAFPEVTDFLAGKIFEDFNVATSLFTTEYLTSVLSVKVNICGNRYVVVSYGKTTTYTHALIYDITFKRWGKLRLDHVDAFSFEQPDLYGEITYTQMLNVEDLYSDLYDSAYSDFVDGSYHQTTIPKRAIGLLQEDGTIYTANFDIKQANNLGVLLLGKFQFVRDHFMQLHAIEVENVQSDAADFLCKVLPTLDGKNFTPAVNPTATLVNTGLYRRYGFHTSAKNLSALFTGTFYMSSVELWFSELGNY